MVVNAKCYVQVALNMHEIAGLTWEQTTSTHIFRRVWTTTKYKPFSARVDLSQLRHRYNDFGVIESRYPK